MDRIAMIEMNDTVSPAAHASAMPTTVTVDGKTSPILSGAVAGGQVSAVARTRVEGQQAHLAERGFTKAKGAGEKGITAWRGLAIGTRVNTIGDENFAASRVSFEEKPTALAALEKLATTIEAEGRMHVEHVRLGSLTCRAEDGAIAAKNGEWHVFQPTTRALSHLGNVLAPSDTTLARYLPNAPVSIRREIVSTYTALHRASEKTAAKEITLGLRRNVPGKTPAGITTLPVRDGSPDAVECYRIASDRYVPYEAHTAARDIIAGCADELAGSRAEVVYDGDCARLTFWFHADHVVDLAAGDVFKAGIILNLDDVRGGSIKVRSSVIRNKCLNLIILGKQTKTNLVQRHVGKGVTEIAANVKAGIAQAASDLSYFVKGWHAARQDRIVDAFSGDPRKVFEGLVGAGLTKLGGSMESQVDRLMTAWQAEPGYTRADVVNAVTRAAHADAWWTSAFGGEDVEEQAGQLLYVHNIARRIDSGRATYADKMGIEFT
jgi:hypothetical protein